MDYYHAWECEMSTNDLSFRLCQLSVIYMSGCLYVDDVYLVPIRDVVVQSEEKDDWFGSERRVMI